MRNTTLLVTNLLIAAFPTHVFAHTGEHHGNWLSNLVHFITSPVHLPVAIPVVIILGLVIHGIRKRALSKQPDTQ
jgi:type IV secretory pathway VirB2 component (pilin)